MKKLLAILLIVCSVFSCSSGKSSSKKNTKKSENSEIGYVEMEGGETLKVYGYSKDPEVARKMKLLDMDFIDCYQDTIKPGEAENMNIDFLLSIDIEGFFEMIEIEKMKSKNANKIAKCIKKEMEQIGVRPGKSRDAEFHLSYKIVREKHKEKEKHKINDLRSKTIASLAKMKKFKECFDNRKAKNPKLQGKFTLKFTIDPDGEVYDIKLRNNTFTDKYVINCTVEKLEDTVFPKGDSDDEVEVNFDYTATSDNPRPDKPRKSLSL
ncbi:AgmX/PglI C-terminal domain-containing protein [bacterium]|nr:AgmX/PglI C-terminal domain-containing protein [bacterium]